MIVERKEMKEVIYKMLKMHKNQNKLNSRKKDMTESERDKEEIFVEKGVEA